MATERTGYTAGGALTGVGGTFALIFISANPKVDPFNSAWFVTCFVVAIFGALVVALTGIGHFISGWKRRVRYDPHTRQFSIAVNQEGVEEFARLDTPVVETVGSLYMSLVITPQRHGTFAVMSTDVPEYSGLIEVRVRAYIANPHGCPPVTLLTATAKIQLDDLPVADVETQPSQYSKHGDPPPTDYKYPPEIGTGQSLDTESIFFVHTQGSANEGWIQPRSGKITDFTVTDQFGMPSRCNKEIEFRISAMPAGWENRPNR